MSRVSDYLNSHAQSMRAEFETLRVAQRDSAVKGVGNEAIVGEFLRRHLHPRRIVYNSTIINSLGGQSDEVDIAVCNEDQPFITGERAQLLLVEGVDLAIQVKARLSSQEVARIVGNARTVKKLVRSSGPGDSAGLVKKTDLPNFVFRTAYLAFCFESELTPQFATLKLRAECDSVALEDQPDALFILDRGSILNTRHNDGVITTEPRDVRGFAHIDGPDRVLLRMMQLISLLPRIRRQAIPLSRYLADAANGQKV